MAVRAARLGGSLDVEPLGQDVGEGDDAEQVIHIAANAARDPWVLDFHRHAPPVMQRRAMYLRMFAPNDDV